MKSGVGVDSWSKHPFFIPILSMVSYFLLPETRPHDVVSTHHECYYTFFLFILSICRVVNVFFVGPINDIKRIQVWGRDGGWSRHRKP